MTPVVAEDDTSVVILLHVYHLVCSVLVDVDIVFSQVVNDLVSYPLPFSEENDNANQ